MLEERRDEDQVQERPEATEEAPVAEDSAPVEDPFGNSALDEPADESAPGPAEEGGDEPVEEELEASAEEGGDEPVEEEPEAPAEVGAELESEAGNAEAVELEAPRNPKMKWYAVHTYSGHENKVRSNLLRRVRLEGMEDRIGQALVPTVEVTEMKKGKKSTAMRKYFPSYILVEMEMCDEAFHLVNGITGVTSFVGLDMREPSKRPLPLRPAEVDRILGRIERPAEHTPTEIPYQVGDHVKVMDGPFSDFNGVVDEVNHERGTLKVMVTIFGRETPVELDFLQVEPV